MSRRIPNVAPYEILKGEPKLVLPPSEVNPSGTYFLSYGELTPDVDPIDVQESSKRQAKVQIIYLKAAQKLAKAKGISEEDANRQFFAQRVKVGDTDVINDAEESILNWIDDDQAADLLTLNAESAKNIDRVVTLFTRHRILYGVQVAEKAGTKARSLKITKPWFIIGAGDWLSLNGVHFQVATAYDDETGEIGVDGLPRSVEAGEVLFVVKHDRSALEVGDDQWTDELTNSLAAADKAAVYQFYLKEAGRLVENPAEVESEEGKQPLTSKSTKSKRTSKALPSTGESSIGESIVPEVQQNSSEPIDTEVAPVLEF